LLGLVGSNQSAVEVGTGARFASSKLTLLARNRTTSWTANSEYLFQAEFLFHGDGNHTLKFEGKLSRKDHSLNSAALRFGPALGWSFQHLNVFFDGVDQPENPFVVD
jgi:hypothetical protein